MVIPIPEALRQNLIEFAPAAPPVLQRPRVDPVKLRTIGAVRCATSYGRPSTAPWPTTHRPLLKRRRRNSGLTNFPSGGGTAEMLRCLPRVLIADEVGLGKTIQAGAVLKTLINQGKADRVLILTPAVARWQWQQELRHKFNIEVPVLDRRGAQLQLVSSDGSREVVSNAPWRRARTSHPLL